MNDQLPQGPLGQIATQRPVPGSGQAGPGFDRLLEQMMSRAQQRMEAGPPPAQSPETMEAMQQHMQQMQQPVDTSSKWWKMAAGFLSPTKTGTSAEGLGLGINAYADARSKEEEALRAQQNAARQMQLQQMMARDKAAMEAYDKDEKMMWDYAGKQLTRRDTTANLGIRAVELLKKNKEHTRQILQNDTSISPQQLEQLVNQRAMAQTVNELRGVYTDEQLQQFKRQLEKILTHIDSIQTNLKESHLTRHGKPGFDIKAGAPRTGGFSIKERRP